MDVVTEKQRRLYNNFLNDVEPLMKYFDDKTLTDIYVNPSGEIITESFVAGKKFTGEFISAEQVQAIIISAAALMNWKINPDLPVPKVEGVLPKPYNFRFTGIMPPASNPSAIALRRPSEKVFSMEEYVEQGRLKKYDYDTICRTVKRRGNILLGGQTGSGKTTFANAILKKMVEYTPYDRFYIVEDVPELICTARDVVPLLATNPENAASELVQESLRFTPKRIIFGELRYPKVAFDLVTSWNTGHNGNLTTIHANTAMSMIPRLKNLYMTATGNTITPDFADIISLCVHLAATPKGPVIDEVLPLDKKVFNFIEELERNGME